ncbi:DUF4255 domain-containing protein [Rhizobium terrae]|uniref:DUF4255 domain-containing protein n=1 Tax=Rhizobium terrae TaxID=2171756 RepID=UPI000E3C2E41|nr:DUF4255 domain-containing protein [Rhizobium terrae]
MANHLAIATVTAALQQALQSALNTDVPGAQVKIGRPAATGNNEDDSPGVNLFLYQVAPNAAGRNAHLASRDSAGRMRGPDIVALDLFYLLSFSGTPSDFAPERLLASVARIVEHRPLITPAMIAKAIAENPSVLDDADLQRAGERVRASPIHLSLDEMSKLWSVLFQVPYALSVAYRFGPVYIETRASGSPGLPVTQVGSAVLMLSGPRLAGAEAPEGAGWPIVWGGSVVLTGEGLARSDLELRIGGITVGTAGIAISAKRVVISLVAATFGGSELPAGPVLIEIVVPPPAGAPPHLARVGDTAVFVLKPVLTLPANALVTDPAPLGEPVDGTLKVKIVPKVVKRQTVHLLLDGKGSAPRSFRLAHEAVADAAYPVDELVFPFTDVAPDDYHVQIVVDGVASAPEIDDDPLSVTYRQILGPMVTIP